MCKRECEHYTNEDTDTDNKGKGVSWIGMIVS